MKKMIILTTLLSTSLLFAGESTSKVNSHSGLNLDITKGIQFETAITRLSVQNNVFERMNGISIGLRKNYALYNKFSGSTGIGFTRFASSENLKINGNTIVRDSLSANLSLANLSQRIHYNIMSSNIIIKPYIQASISSGKAEIEKNNKNSDSSVRINQLSLGSEFHITNELAIDLNTSLTSNIDINGGIEKSKTFGLGFNYSL